MNKDNLYIHAPYQFFVKNIDMFLTHGFNIEIYFDCDTLDGHVVDKAKGLCNLMRDNGLNVIAHGIFMDLYPASVDKEVREVGIKRYIQVLQLCDMLDIRNIVLHHGYSHIYHRFFYDRWINISKNSWEQITQYAEKYDIVIGLENAFELTPELISTIVTHVNSKYLNICFDIGHFHASVSKVSLEKWINTFKPKLVEVHIHDNYGDEDTHSALGDGNIDFELLFKLLKDKKGIIYTLEHKAKQDVFKSIKYLADNYNLMIN
jgi:sugar phosphate isomerase/epimerase